MYWHRIAYSVLMVPLRTYSLTITPMTAHAHCRRWWQ